MRLHSTDLPGVVRIEPERLSDERGFFARTYCREELAAAGLDPEIAQCSLSFNPTKGTLRGMHYQAEPHGETKLIRCTMGSIYDVLVDLRPQSPAFKRYAAFTLTAETRELLYVPPGIAHGFITLTPDCEVFYQISVPYHAESARGVRWDDPAFGIEWPAEPTLISDRDRDYPDFED